MNHLSLYSNTIPLFYHKKTKYSNIFDYILTFITFILTIIISIHYILELKKRQPYLYHQADTIIHEGNYTFTDFPFYIALTFIKTSTFLPNFTDYLTPYLSYNNREEFHQIILRYCDEKQQKEIRKIFNYPYNLDFIFLCPNFNGKNYTLTSIRNSVRLNEYTFTLSIFKHENVTFPDYEQFELFVLWKESYLDMSDYNNPIKTIGKSKGLFFKNDRFENYRFFYNLNTLNTDKALFFNKKEVINYLTFDSLDYASITNRTYIPGYFYSFITMDIILNSNHHFDHITYMKIPDILTKIVSVYSIIFTFSTKFSGFIRSKSLIIDISNNLNERINNNIINVNNDSNFNNNSNDIVDDRIIKLNCFEYLLPSFLLKKRKNVKLYIQNKKFISSILSVQTLIDFYLRMNNNNINFNFKNEGNNAIINPESNHNELLTKLVDDWG